MTKRSATPPALSLVANGISAKAIQHGAKPAKAGTAIWSICLAGGFVSNGGYSIVRFFRIHTWSKLVAARTGSHSLFASSKGVPWTVGVLIYGWGAANLGSWGASVGWPMFQATIILACFCRRGHFRGRVAQCTKRDVSS